MSDATLVIASGVVFLMVMLVHPTTIHFHAQETRSNLNISEFLRILVDLLVVRHKALRSMSEAKKCLPELWQDYRC